MLTLLCFDTGFLNKNLQGQFLSALDSLLQYAEDLLVDIPKFWDFLAEVGRRACFANIFQYSWIH